MKYLMSLSLFAVSCSHQNTKVAIPVEAHHREVAQQGSSEVPLIPRSVLFSPGEIMRVRMSPDGKWLASVRPLLDQGKNKYNIFITSMDKPHEVGQAVLPEPVERMPMYQWSMLPGFMTYTKDIGGNENDQLFLVDINSKKEVNLTNNTAVKVRGVHFNQSKPNFVYFSSNARDPKYFDQYVLDLTVRQVQMLYQNDESFLSILFNEKDQPRFAYKYNEQGGMDTFVYNLKTTKWVLYKTIPFEFVPGFSLLAFDQKNDNLYYLDGQGSDTGDLLMVNLQTQKSKVIVKKPKAQISGGISPFDEVGGPLAYIMEYEKPEVVALNKKFAQELKSLSKQLPKGSSFSIVSQTQKDEQWLLALNLDRASIHYYLWNRMDKKAQFLFAMKPELDKQPLVAMHPVIIKSRDGLKLVSYLSLPAGQEWDAKNQKIKGSPLPLILDVHGGPWARDSWGFSASHQLYANRGYAVLSVNFRGSTGFGQAFERASFGEWGAKMHDDLIDATQWAIQHKIAIADKVVISGGSYGGYATLIGLTFTPDVFAAGVNTVGVANLVTMQQSIPSYWKPFRANSIRRMGADVETPEGQAFLWERSPLSRVDQIKKPLLIGHGDNDPRVKLAEAQQITDAMVKHKLPVTLVRFPDEGHGFARPENSATFIAIEENFLASILGGRSEPIEIAPQSSINVSQGADLIKGLCEALKKVKKSGQGCH